MTKRKPKKLPKPVRAWACLVNGKITLHQLWGSRKSAWIECRYWDDMFVIPVEIRPLRSSPTTLERIGRESLKMYARYGCGDWPYGPSMRKLMQLCQSVDNRPLRKKVRRG